MSKNQNLLSCENIKTIEDYGTVLVCAMLSVASLESYETTTYKLGLFEPEEEEASKTICWELRRLMQLYTEQFKRISERCELTQETVLKALAGMMHEELPAKKPKRKPRKKKADGENADSA